MRTADLIVDCVPDELESKLEIFSLLDRMAPPLAIFVTKSLSIADLGLLHLPRRSLRGGAVRFEETPDGRGRYFGLDYPDFL